MAHLASSIFFSQSFLDMRTFSLFNIEVRTIELTPKSTADNFFNFSTFSSTFHPVRIHAVNQVRSSPSRPCVFVWNSFNQFSKDRMTMMMVMMTIVMMTIVMMTMVMTMVMIVLISMWMYPMLTFAYRFGTSKRISEKIRCMFLKISSIYPGTHRMIPSDQKFLVLSASFAPPKCHGFLKLPIKRMNKGLKTRYLSGKESNF